MDTTKKSFLLERIIEASARNPFLVILFTLFGIGGGIWALTRTPLDAIPDLSDVQVIISADWEGRSPDLVEDQITYPIATKFISAPKVKFVRGESMFGKSFVYVIFEDGTDIYWARSRVIEYLNSVQGSLPEGVTPTIGPDATGVGWVYEYALVDTNGTQSLADLRSLQDWHLRYALESVPGVAEVASVGGFVKEYQVDLDPNKLAAYGIPLSDVVEKIRMSNNDVGGKILKWRQRNITCAGVDILKVFPTLKMFRSRLSMALQFILRMSARFTWGLICAGAWLNWTAKAKSLAVLWSCAMVKMHSRSSTALKRNWPK